MFRYIIYYAIITILLFTQSPAFSQGSYTNYCPEEGYEIRISLTLEYQNTHKEKVFEASFKNVEDLLKHKELKTFNWAASFEQADKHFNCFRVEFKQAFRNLLFDRAIQAVHVAYHSNKDFMDEVKITYRVKDNQISSHVRNKFQDH